MYKDIWATMSENVPSDMHGHPVKIQISLHIHEVWSESSIETYLIAMDAKFIHADNKDSDQTAQICRLIWVFVGHTEGIFSHVGAHM